MRSLKVKLAFANSLLGFIGILLLQASIYSVSANSAFRDAETRAEVLSDEIVYSLEMLATENDRFAMQRLVEKSSTLEGVIQIFIVDTNQIVLAHTNKQLVGKQITSPLFESVLHQRTKINQTKNQRIIYVSPLRGQAYTTEFLNVTGALWVEIDISPVVLQLTRSFQLVTLASIAALLIFYAAQYFINKKLFIDRLEKVKTGISFSIQKEKASAVHIGKTLGSEDEINDFANTYNYLITSLHESQETLKAERDFALHIMESMGEGLTITNAEGRFEYVNPAYARMVGYPAELLIGNSPEMVTIPTDIKKSDEAWQLRRSGKTSTYEVRLQTKEGTEVQALITSVPRLKDRQFSGSIAVITNISERAKLEQMKSDFINRASHELRTPLTTAILMADLLEDATEQDKKKFTGILKQELNRQRLLLEDLLIAGRIETRGFKIHCAFTEIEPIINEAIACVTPQADLHKIFLNKQIEKMLPIVYTDRLAILQVIINLLTNAVKFSRRNGSILISASSVETSVLITVQDFGIGIPSQDSPHIMSRFFRAQNATKLEIPGTGIGLYIIKEIMDALGGRIEIDSIEDQGTTVSVFLPIQGGDSIPNLAEHPT